MTSSQPIRTAIIGYGTGGRVFHGPLLQADPRFEVSAVVARDETRRGQAAAVHPAAALLDSADQIYDLAERIELVVVTTPPSSHHELAAAALEHGANVVVDKPFVIHAEQGRDLIERAARADLMLTVFHNRRYDGDFRTVRRLVASELLGDIRSLESRFEWWKPGDSKAWKAHAGPEAGGGILYDLGPHLIDQVIQLFGPVESVRAELTRYRDGEGGDDEAFVSIEHADGVRSHLAMNSLAPIERPRFTLVGSTSGFVKYGLDVQEGQLARGMAPTDARFGREAPPSWGQLGGRDGTEQVSTERGRYPEFYGDLALALLHGGTPPVDPADAVRVIELIERIYAESQIRRGR
jgi:scyllo-inositol 2-dehydrogenase (NADP+)